MGKSTILVSDQVHTTWHVQSLKNARNLKFWILKVEEELYYTRSKNKGTDQLCSNCAAYLQLCFRLCIFLVFFCSCPNINDSNLYLEFG